MNTQIKTNKTLQIALALATVYIVWGSTYLAIQYAIETIPPFFMAAVRFLAAGAVLYIFLRFRGFPKPTKEQWKSAFIIGGLLLVGGNGGVVWAEQTVPSGMAALLVSVVPMWMTLFNWIRPGGTRPQTQIISGLILGFIGLIILLGLENISSPVTLTPGFIALIIAPITWSIGSVYTKQAPLPASPFMSTAIEMIGGGLLLLFSSLMVGELGTFSLTEISASSCWALIYLIFIGALVGFTAYVWLLKHASLPVASTYAYINPVVAVLLGWALAGEILTARTAFGGALALVAVALITIKSNAKKPI